MARTTDITHAATELRFVIGQLSRRLRTDQSLPISHGATLGRLDREGPLTTSGLAGAERVRPQSMAQTILDLEAGGLVARRRDEVDRRQVLIEITEHGRDTLELERRRQGGWLADTMRAELSPDEQEVIVRAVPLLSRIAQL